MGELCKEFIENVKKGLERCCVGRSRLDCVHCPYISQIGCTSRVKKDALVAIGGLQTQLTNIVETNEKNVSELYKAKMEIEYHMDQAESLDRTIREQEEKNARLVDKLITAEMEYNLLKDHTEVLEEDIRALKEDNAKLAEQNKKLLEKEIENTRLRNENQTIREDNKYLDERNDKLEDELRNRDIKIRDLMEEIDRQNKELYHRREWEQLVRSQPTMILHTEPVKIEPIDYSKIAKAANKAAKSLDEAARSMEKLNDLSTAVGLGVITKNNARRVVDDPTFRSPRLEETFVCCGDVVQIGKHLHIIRAYGNNYFTDQCGTNIRYDVADKLYRVRSDCKLMLVWEKVK